MSMFSSIFQLEKFNPKNYPKWSNFDPDFQGNLSKIWTLNFASVTCGRPLPPQHTMKRDETLWKDASWSVEHNPKIWARLEKCLSIFSSPTFRSKFSLGGSLYRAPPCRLSPHQNRNFQQRLRNNRVSFLCDLCSTESSDTVTSFQFYYQRRYIVLQLQRSLGRPRQKHSTTRPS